MSDDFEARERAPWWAVTLAVLAVLIWCVASIPSLLEENRDAINTILLGGDAASAYGGIAGDITGHALFRALIVSVLLFLIFVREKSASRAFYYCFMLFAVAVIAEAGLLAPMIFRTDQAQWAAANRSIRRIELNVLSGTKIDTQPVATGDAGVVEGLMRQCTADIAADGKAYRDDLAALDYPGFMKRERLAKRGGLRTAREGLRKAHALVAKYHALIDARFATFRHQLETAPIAPGVRQQVLTGFNGAMSAARLRLVDRNWEIEDAILTDLDKDVALLQRPDGSWRVVGDKMVFSSANDLQAYNAIAIDLRRLVAEQTEIRTNARAHAMSEASSIPSGN